MTPNEISVQKRILIEHAELVYGDQSPLSRSEFLTEVWRAISRFTHHNKMNPLMIDAVSRCNYLIPWGYTILTILFGSYTYQPTKFQVLKDYIRLLDRDLCEEEIHVTKMIECTFRDSLLCSQNFMNSMGEVIFLL